MSAESGIWLRPASAARRFEISERTLARWAQSGLISRSQRGRIVHYLAADIADVLDAGATPRTVVPISAQPAPAPVDDDAWKRSKLWAGRV